MQFYVNKFSLLQFRLKIDQNKIKDDLPTVPSATDKIHLPVCFNLKKKHVWLAGTRLPPRPTTHLKLRWNAHSYITNVTSWERYLRLHSGSRPSLANQIQHCRTLEHLYYSSNSSLTFFLHFQRRNIITRLHNSNKKEVSFFTFRLTCIVQVIST